MDQCSACPYYDEEAIPPPRSVPRGYSSSALPAAGMATLKAVGPPGRDSMESSPPTSAARRRIASKPTWPTLAATSSGSSSIPGLIVRFAVVMFES